MLLPKQKLFKDQRGQILPLALAAFVAGILLFLFLVKAGGLLVQRERARMRTDVTAYSIGVDYARALNVLAVTETVVSTGHLISFVPIAGSVARSTVEFLQKFQNIMLKFGPWLNEGSAVFLGMQNGLIAMPLWNTEDLIQDFDVKNLLPSYNVESRGVIGWLTDTLSGLLGNKVDPKKVVATVRDLEKEFKSELGDQGLKKLGSMLKKSLPGVDLDWLLTKTGYSKQPKKGGPRDYIDLDKGKTQVERKAGGGYIERSHEIGTGKKVKVENGINLDLPLDLEESGGHYITLIAPMVPKLEPSARPGQPWIWSIAQVKVDGGNFKFFSTGSVSFKPRLVPVKMSIKMPRNKITAKYRFILDEKNDPIGDVTHEYDMPSEPKLKETYSVADLHQELDRLPFDWQSLPGASYVEKAFEVLDIQH